jgi:tetratricopeptide (TPR) repeat protein
MPDAANELLAELCRDLRVLREQAGGPSLRGLARRVGLGKTQVGAILTGHVRTPPDWQVLRSLVECCYKHAHDHGRAERLSLRAGLDEYWRPRYAVLEHAFSQRPTDGEQEAEEGTRPPPRSRSTRITECDVPRQLPSAIRAFAGRCRQIAELDQVLTGVDESSVIVLLSGTAGVGKTTLALHWAHRVAARFPDGQLYVNLRGFDPGGSVVDPANAIRGFLGAFGVPPEKIPTDLDAQTALYRSVLAGKRVLVVLDNARDVEQARPLLPGTAGCLVVVTSRNQLAPLVAGEGAEPLILDLLDVDGARQLLSRRIGADRVAAEPEAVEAIITACAQLPLALAIVAARAAIRPGFPLASLAAELREATGVLDGLAGGDLGIDVRDVFSWSYNTLSPDAARLFRLLGLHPGPDISAAAAASLAGLPRRRLLRLLSELTLAHLLMEYVPGRFTFHDLLREYAAERAAAIDSEAMRHEALHRVYDHYLHTARAASRELHPPRDPIMLGPARRGVTTEEIRGHAQALSWFTSEHSVLMAVVKRAPGAGLDSHVPPLAWLLVTFFDFRGHWDDWAATQISAIAAAQRLGDRMALARAHRELGRQRSRIGRYDDAEVHLEQALGLYAELGDFTGQGRVRSALGWLAGLRGDHRKALDQCRTALEIFRAAGYRAGEATALNAVGWRHAQLGDYAAARTHCEQAIALLREVGDRAGEADAWDSLGYVNHRLRRYDEARAGYERALVVYRDIGDRSFEATTLVHLGDTHDAAGDPVAARATWRQALTILDELARPDADEIRAKLAS